MLNAVLKTQIHKKITFIPSAQQPEVLARKQSIVNVLYKDDDCQYIVEMQIANTGGFEKRTQYYTPKAALSHQLNIGRRLQKTKKIIFLTFTNHSVFSKRKTTKVNTSHLTKKQVNMI